MTNSRISSLSISKPLSYNSHNQPSSSTFTFAGITNFSGSNETTTARFFTTSVSSHIVKHSSDLWYWFGTLPNCWRPMEEKDYALSNQMTDYLCNFAKTGNPNAKELPLWESSQAVPQKAMCLGEQPSSMKKPGTLQMIYTMLTNKAVGE